MATHAVLNQPPPLIDVDVTAADPALAAARRDALDAGGGVPAPGGSTSTAAPTSAPTSAAAGGPEAWLADLGALAGSADILEHARLANDWPPQLRSHDRFGHRIDEVEFHPSWHVLLRAAVEHGLHAAAWDPAAGPGAHARRAAGFYVWTQAESGQMCPISMTYASIPAHRCRKVVCWRACR